VEVVARRENVVAALVADRALNDVAAPVKGRPAERVRGGDDDLVPERREARDEQRGLDSIARPLRKARMGHSNATAPSFASPPGWGEPG
jgi:hypothetical protein